MLRQQAERSDPRKPHRSLVDYVAPRETGLADDLGAFAVTTGLGADELAYEFEQQNDDYHAIMVKPLADRLAEAFAEYLHLRARRDWGYGTEEHLSSAELIAQKFRGIRPAFGYPACPDHLPQRTLFELLGPHRAGMGLTESGAMVPPASVSGPYFAHPRARYFDVGRVGADQVEDYALRMGESVADVERWLRPILGYDPVEVPA